MGGRLHFPRTCFEESNVFHTYSQKAVLFFEMFWPEMFSKLGVLRMVNDFLYRSVLSAKNCTKWVC